MRTLRNFLENANFNRISLKKINSNHFQIQAKINGIKGVFILDTGASTTCISRESIHHFQLEVQESHLKAAGAGSTEMETQLAEGYSIEIGDWKKKKTSFVVIDFSHVNKALTTVDAKPVHGIIGADILKAGKAVIDYGRNCLYIK